MARNLGARKNKKKAQKLEIALIIVEDYKIHVEWKQLPAAFLAAYKLASSWAFPIFFL
jgi:hypothetical protein